MTGHASIGNILLNNPLTINAKSRAFVIFFYQTSKSNKNDAQDTFEVDNKLSILAWFDWRREAVTVWHCIFLAKKLKRKLETVSSTWLQQIEHIKADC